MDVNLNDKDKEKLGSSVAAQTSDSLAYLPLKKRRPRLRSPSPPPQTPLDSISVPHNSASDPKPLATNSQVIEPLASVACKTNNSDDVHNAEVGVNQEKSTLQETVARMDTSSLEKSVTDTSNSQSIENALVKTNTSSTEDSFASVACKKNNVDVHNADLAVKQERCLTSQGIDACIDVPSLGKTMNGASNNLVEVQKSQSIENAFVKTNLSRAEDTIDVHNAGLGVKPENLLTPQGIDACIDMSSLKKTMIGASQSLVEVQRNQSIETTLAKTNIPSMGNSFTCELLASVACKENYAVHIRDTEVSVKQEKLLSPEGVDACMDMPSLRKTTTGASVSLLEVQRSQTIENNPVKTDFPVVTSYASSKNNDVGVNQEKLLTSQETDACLEMSPLGKTMTSIEEANLSLKVSTCEAHSNSATVPLNLLDKSENDAKKGFDSAKGVRFHWDLNTVMDDWELPADDPSFGSKGNNIENISSEGLQGAKSDNLVSNIWFDDSVNARRLPNSTSNVNVSPQLKRKLSNLYNGSSSEGRINTSTKLTILAREDLCGKNVKLEKQDDILVHPIVSDKSIRDMVPIKSEHEHNKLCEVANVGNTASKFTVPVDANNLSSKSDRAILPTVVSDNITITPSVTTHDECQPVPVFLKKENDLYSPTKVSPLRNPLSDVEQFGRPETYTLGNSSSDAIKELMSKSYGQFIPQEAANPVNHSSDIARNELIPKPFEQFVPPKIAIEVNPSPNVETREPISTSHEVNHSPVAETKELMPKSREHSGEVALEDPLDDGDVSDLSLGGHNHSVSLGKETKYPTGNESPFEDGEVREMDEFSWEENECETDCVDYDIDDRDGYEYGTDNLNMLEANEENANFIEKGTCESANSLKDSNTSASAENISGQDQIAMAVEANNSKAVEMVISDSIRRLDTKGSFTKEIRSRELRENLSSRVGESLASGPTDEKDNVFIQQHRSGPRFQASQVFRGNRYLGGDRHVSQMQDEGRKNNWNGSSSRFLNSRNHFSNKYQRGGTHSLQRSTVPDSETDDYHDQRQSTNYSAKGSYRPFIRKRPLENSEKDFSTQRRNVESRVDEYCMMRGRSGIYHRGGFRGPRGSDNHGPISNDSAPSSGFMQARRRRSSSPILNRNPSFSRPCRRSRSRTRSPIQWRVQEERNKGPRIERTRIHYDDTKFEDNDNAFCSPPRKRFSSQGNSGSFNDRSGGPSRFRERNSPGRFVGQRLERMKSDEGFRPGVHPQRFSKPSGEVWRGHNHTSNNNERTKYSNRNEMIHRGGRQNGNNSVIRRFCNDEDDSFDGHNNRNNKGWEGRGPFKYDRERN